MENSQLLERHFAGTPLHELAELEGVNSPETARTRLAKAKRDVITGLAMDLLAAKGDTVWLVVNAKTGKEVGASLRYLAWIVEELDELTFKVAVEVKQGPDGIAFGLTDSSRAS